MVTARTDPSAIRIPDGYEIDPDATELFNRRRSFPWTDEPVSLLATKEGDMVLYADQEGNLRHGELGMGLYFRDTRFLSHYMMLVGGRSPVLLSASAERAFMSYVDLTNPPLGAGEDAIRAQTINIRRTRVIRDRLYERIRFKNYNASRVRFRTSLTFGSDFDDIFQVRGWIKDRNGVHLRPKITETTLTLGHVGEDGLLRRIEIDFGREPASVEMGLGTVTLHFDMDLVAGQTRSLSLVVEPVIEDQRTEPVGFDVAVHELRRSYDEWDHSCTHIATSNELFNTLLQRGRRDLRALLTETPQGRYIAAGIPWYIAAFGRDSLITAHQILMLDSGPARDTLRLLASLQGTKDDPWRDEEPGKILHEIRTGPLSNAGIVPHTPYYGSIDATPLFLVLYGTYFKWTNDRTLAQELLPNVERALQWIDERGDIDGDGFLEYERKSERGLDNQGWKDSHDSIVHADGTLAEPPIALVEVQAYVYLAKLRVADVFEAIGRASDAARLRAEADDLIFDEIARRRADPRTPERDDVMSVLLQARDEQGRALTDAELRDELMTLLVAGHETTATALAWTFDLLVHEPAAMARLEQEIASDRDGPYLDAVIRESLRMRPVLPGVVRKLTAPWTLEGYDLPAGIRVAPNIWLTHHRSDIYPDPEAFRPERFLEQPADTYSWLPFGGGIRRCLGASFALFEMKTVLPTVLRRVRLTPGAPRRDAIKRRAITFAPEHGAMVVAHDRERGPAVAPGREAAPVAQAELEPLTRRRVHP
jgi:glycogen debranching enzyme